MTMTQLPVLNQTRPRSQLAPRTHHLRVALISMPFVSATRPSIQLGLLKAIGAEHGFHVETFHLNLELAQQLGLSAYERLCQHRGRMFGEWLFSQAVYQDRCPDPDHVMATVFPAPERGGFDSNELIRIRCEVVPRYLAEMRELTDWRAFDVVGFTSTFQQTMASAAMAAEIRSVHPRVKIIFGGANLDGVMGAEIVRALPVVDYAVSGEADSAFPALLDAIERDVSPKDIAGVIARREDDVIATPPGPPLEALDELPTPDYSEYFARVDRLQLLSVDDRRAVYLPFESSRGCWWGAKKHCTFCGLNGSTMKYRAKSAARVLEELASLTRRHGSFTFEAVDNIMDHAYLKTLLPELVEQGSSYRFFYEIKSNVGREELRLMQQAGVVTVQPGIESLSSAVLRLMRKGVKAIQNVNLLRWTRYYGLTTSWNVLWGFPGERAEDYEAQAALMPRLVHLEPPSACGPVWLERFSPLFRERENFPLERLTAEQSYRYVYPADVDLERLAFFFDYELRDTLARDSFGAIADATRHWQKRAAQEPAPALWFFRAPGYLEIDDRREADQRYLHSFEGELAELYFAVSDRPHRPEFIKAQLGLDRPLPEIVSALDEFCSRGLMMEDEGSYLALALPAGGMR